jgi:DNA-binding transcriptional MerR regulator
MSGLPCSRQRPSSIVAHGQIHMKISEIAKLLGVTTSKVRFLEAQALVHPSRNPLTGYRSYDNAAVARLSFIIQAQSFGFRIAELRHLFAEGGERALSSEFVIERMTNKLEELRRDIARVCATRDRLIEGIDEVKARVRRLDDAANRIVVAQPFADRPIATKAPPLTRRGRADQSSRRGLAEVSGCCPGAPALISQSHPCERTKRRPQTLRM